MRRPTTSTRTRKQQCRAPRTPCRTATDVVARFAQGAKTVVIDAPPEQILELHDLEGTGTLRITGSTPHHQTKSRAIVVTDAAQVQLKGHTRCFAYTIAIIEAFDDTEVEARNKSIVYAVDRAKVRATDESTIHAYDQVTVHAEGHTTVHATDNSRILLHDNAHAIAQRGVTIHGPARTNTRIRQ
ncbi:hypothetical protein [Rhodococcus sp. T7]|uniref:hypothetical protein n=1 Tax=Rhodococcus sp. T7 TaxID=627444 RepID=UPI00135AD4BC|nr:hypothetical protein [Rhodococcus sp. T7]KAF0957435.1 hypothetical protein MLGJGCBP_09267 [Rhodococcus sp. T7]KAF0962094.1 hypothetical protein MLGJGCBP_04715 [Rhodococcus sp. T7]